MKALTLRHTALAVALALAQTQGAWAGTATVVLTGDAALGTKKGVTFVSLAAPPLNASGQTAFSAFVTGPGVAADNNFGIWINSGLVARTGRRGSASTCSTGARCKASSAASTAVACCWPRAPRWTSAGFTSMA